jgi:hypothetical protein
MISKGPVHFYLVHGHIAQSRVFLYRTSNYEPLYCCVNLLKFVGPVGCCVLEVSWVSTGQIAVVITPYVLRAVMSPDGLSPPDRYKPIR